MRQISGRRKVFDWLIRFGIIASVALVGGGVVWAEDAPAGRKGGKSKLVSERSEEEEEDSGVIEIVVKIPKPEALIFSRRMDTKYTTLDYEKSFTDEIIESAKHSPF